MERYTTKKISLEKVKSDMILARDIVTPTGQVLFTKGTFCEQLDLNLLVRNGIDYILVKGDPIPGEFIDSTVSSVAYRDDFMEFEQSYEETKEKTKKLIQIISQAEKVTKNDIFELTKDSLSKIKIKSDLLIFIDSLQQTNTDIYAHSINVGLLCNLFGNWLKLNDEDLINLTIAGTLHDIGKTLLSPQLLAKKDSLSDDEKFLMRQHTTYGYRLLQDQNLPESIKLVALMHHEKNNGTGYPNGLRSEKITHFSKIVTICDIYENLTSGRKGNRKTSPFEAIKEFETNGLEIMDPGYLMEFLRHVAYTYIGSEVVLSNNSAGEVVFINQSKLSAPIVRLQDGTFINLYNHSDLSVKLLK